MQNITQTLLPGLQPAGAGAVLLTVNGIAVGALSPQEASLYPSLFKMALGPKAVQTSTSIPGNVAASFLKRSGLGKKQLHDIWSLSDSENQGYLVPNGFFKACRLVAHAQSSANSAVSADLLAAEPQVLPFFELPEGGNDAVWQLSDVEISRFAELYRREGGSVKLDGSDARALLMRSGLSSSELCDIWDLGDVDKDGKLTFGEFLIVMQLVAKVRDGKAFLPAQLPPALSVYLNTSLPASTQVESVPLSDPLADRAGLAINATDSVSVGAPVGAPVSVPVAARGSVPVSSPRQSFLTADMRPVSQMGFGSSPPKLPTSPVHTSYVTREVVEEQRGVADQYDRRRQFRKQMLDGRSRLEGLRSEARKYELELAERDHHVDRVQDQILTLKQQVAEAEEELDEFRREAGQVGGGDVLLAVSAIKESIGESEREIYELRAQLGRIQREKTDLQSMHSVLVEKKRQAEQDRNLMICGMEADRSKLVAVRAERLQLWEQRHQLTRELTTKTFDQLAAGRQPATTRTNTRDKKGVRAEEQTTPTQANAQWNTFESVPGPPQFGARE